MTNKPKSECCEKCKNPFPDGIRKATKIEIMLGVPEFHCNKCGKGCGAVFPQPTQSWEATAIEQLAEIEHDRWADWHNWSFNHWLPENIQRWNIQARTRYDKLPEADKEKDREQVRRYWPIILGLLKEAREAAKKEGMELMSKVVQAVLDKTWQGTEETVLKAEMAWKSFMDKTVEKSIQQERAEIIKLVEEMKIREWRTDPPGGIGYNQAVGDFLTLINQRKQ